MVYVVTKTYPTGGGFAETLDTVLFGVYDDLTTVHENLNKEFENIRWENEYKGWIDNQWVHFTVKPFIVICKED